MFEFLNSFNFAADQWSVAIICGMLIGIAKTGLSGAGMLVTPLMAGIIGGRAAAGFILPMLCLGDIFGVSYYHRHTSWRHVVRLLPWAFAGIIAGLVIGGKVSDQQFKSIMAVIILFSIVLMIWQERNLKNAVIPNYWWFSALTGLIGGFSTMIGNAAGAVIALYFLSMRLPKNSFIGTQAWFFMIVNLMKVPLHAFFRGTITAETLSVDFALLPAIATGAFVGVKVVKRIPEKPFRALIMAMTVLAAIRLLF